MSPEITDDVRACRAFIEALRRSEEMFFSKDEIIISDRKKIGDPVVCTIEAQKGNGDSSQAKGKAYIYPDMIIICVESARKKLNAPMYPHHYEYLSY
ncbi:MAG: hypothetical protein ACLP9S_04215 [Syntrophales bacterium]